MSIRRMTTRTGLVFGLLLTLSSCDAGRSASPGADTTAPADTRIEPRYATEFTKVVIDPETPATVQLAVQACAGLYNRRLGGSVYTRAEDNDDRWLAELDLTPSETVAAKAFLDACLVEFPTCLRYAYDAQRTLLPSILTVGAVLGAVPLDVDLDVACGEVVFDATVEFAGADTPALATEHAAEVCLAETTGLAMLNPGYEINAPDLAAPDITRDMPSALVDYVYLRKLFVVFLVNGCDVGHEENLVLQATVDAAPWETPLGVFGYNNSWLIGGYMHEAQTHCLESRNMGAIPTETQNLSFFSSRRDPITDTTELKHNPRQEITCDPAKTYVAFVIGDGDNVRFIMSTRNVWLQQRLEDCAREENSCAPITWSISPHLPHLAPDVLEWYYEKARSTGNDYFVLPPSGHFYAYPGSLNEKDGDRFVASTEADAALLGITGTVHWEWLDAWADVETDFLPRYAKVGGAIRGIFPINVPYMFPAFPWWEEGDFYRVLEGGDGGEVVVFRPRQWRGIHGEGQGLDEPFYLTPEEMAAELGAYPPGTVTWVYLTSDGGLSLENSFMELVNLLPDHVELVSADAAAALALQATAWGSPSD
ncbi:MAG: hypothetical protein FJ098_02550 [Deltaproteobacteria bacterium]|nr:hypothetical protein [Deltaproteobacteria bacterium]